MLPVLIAAFVNGWIQFSERRISLCSVLSESAICLHCCMYASLSNYTVANVK